MQHNPGFTKLVTEIKQQIKCTDVNAVKNKLDNNHAFHLIDVREESEYAADCLPTAIHLSKGIIEVKIENIIPDLNAEILLYCGGGSRSALAAENLQRMGYTNVWSMDGGYRGWKAAGYLTKK